MLHQVERTAGRAQGAVAALCGEISQALDGAPLPPETSAAELQELARGYRLASIVRREAADAESVLFSALDKALGSQGINSLDVPGTDTLAGFELRRKAKQNTRIDQAAVAAVLNHEDPRYHPVNATGREPFVIKYAVSKKIMDQVQAENGDYFKRVLAPCMTVADGKSEIKIVNVEPPIDLAERERKRRDEVSEFVGLGYLRGIEEGA